MIKSKKCFNKLKFPKEDFFDIYGIDSYIEHKHGGCKGSLMIDTRVKPHHAPPLILDPIVEKKVDALFESHPKLAKL